MRIAALGLNHEANTFAPVPATLERFQQAGIHEGDAVREQYAGSHATMGGFLALAEARPDVEVVPLLFTRLTPMGTITADAFEAVVGRMVSALADQGPWDAVLLALHGAAVSQRYPDADAEIIRRVRAVVGQGVPVGVALDMHANVSPAMVRNCDVLNLYMTNPHVDPRPRGLECAELIARTVRGEIRPTMALEDPPLVVNILRQGTAEAPMKDLVELATRAAGRPGVLSVSVGEGFPYADVEEMGMTFLAVTDGDPALAREVARGLARAAWDMREHFLGDAWPVEDALRHADAAGRRPTVLLDVGDNIGGGSPGDSTHILHAARRLGVRGLVQSLCDPEAVRGCVEAGVGAQIVPAVGGKTDDLHGEPLPVRATVEVVSDGRFEDPTATHGGFRFFDSGPTAVISTEDGHTLVLTSHPLGSTSLEQLRALGIVPEEQRILVAKGVNSPRAAYEPIAAEMLYLNTPGATSADLSTFTYARRRRPMFPYEPDATF